MTMNELERIADLRYEMSTIESSIRKVAAIDPEDIEYIDFSEKINFNTGNRKNHTIKVDKYMVREICDIITKGYTKQIEELKEKIKHIKVEL